MNGCSGVSVLSLVNFGIQVLLSWYMFGSLLVVNVVSSFLCVVVYGMFCIFILMLGFLVLNLWISLLIILVLWFIVQKCMVVVFGLVWVQLVMVRVVRVGSVQWCRWLIQFGIGLFVLVCGVVGIVFLFLCGSCV